MSDTRSLQERFAPQSRCFGCGPCNSQGLRIRSLAQGDEVIAEWLPAPLHEAFPGVVNGGVIGALFDCHCTWAAAWHLMQRDGLGEPPCIVTANFEVQLSWPTSSERPLHFRARAVESCEYHVIVEATVESDGRTTASCRGTFVAIREGHPAYHRLG
jgi:acyl-coenzyme A thioesterase PaaI-like protein